MAFFLEKKDAGDIPEYLLEENQLPNEANVGIFTSASAGDHDGLQRFYDKGGKPNYFHRPSDGATSLHGAARSGTSGALRCMEFLMLKGAVLDAKMITNQNTPLHEATHHNRQKACGALVNAGAGFLKNAFGNTPLHIAVQQGNIPLALFFLEKGHSVNLCNNRGMTVLHVCASLCKGNATSAANSPSANNSEKYLKLAACIILYGGNVDALDLNKYSALHFASAGGNLDMVQLLVDSGAKVAEKSRVLFGDKVVERIPADVARVNGHVNVQSFLEASTRKLEFGKILATNNLVDKYTKGIVSAVKVKQQKENKNDGANAVPAGSGTTAAKSITLASSGVGGDAEH